MEMTAMRVLIVYIKFMQPIALSRHGSGGRGVAPLSLPLPKGSAHQRTLLYVVEMTEMRVLIVYIKFTQLADFGRHASGGSGVSTLQVPLSKGSAHQGTTLYVMEMPEMPVLTMYIKFTQSRPQRTWKRR
jgi:hypothetical protein